MTATHRYLRTRGLLALAVLLFTSAAMWALPARGPGQPSGVAAAAQAGGTPVLAYYYEWFNASSWGRAKTDYPAIGRYSSDNTSVMRHQIQQAKAAGITGFVVSWKHTPTDDRRLAALMGAAKAEDFKLAVIYQGLDFNRQPQPTGRVQADLQLFKDTYAQDPVFRIFDKPLVIWSGTWMFSTDDISRVAGGLRDRLLVLASEKDPKGYARLAGVTDGDAYYWSSVNPYTNQGFGSKLRAMGVLVHQNHGLWIAPFAPGFDARMVGGEKTVERNDGQTLRLEYGAAISSSPDALGLISWNEFSENTYVEPSEKYGDRYMQVLSGLVGSTPPALSPLAADSSGTSGRGGYTNLLLVGLAVAVFMVAMVLVGRRRSRMAAPASKNSQPGPARRFRRPKGRRPRRLSWPGRKWRWLGPVIILVVAVATTATAGWVSGPRSHTFSTQPDPAAAYLGARPVRAADSVVLGAAGDIACPADAGGLTEEPGRPDSCHMQDTAALLGRISPDAVLAIGDNQYPDGSLARYRASYDKTWGALKQVTYPVPGNHEYGTPDGQGYFDYFGAAAGRPGQGYYSYELGSWHIIALNSECDFAGGCTEGSAQERWLKADLAAHPAACTLAYWHEPRFSSGTHGSNPVYDAFWKDLVTAHADVILNGHDHDYERLAQLLPDGTADPGRGIREFVVGTGGDSHYKFHALAPGSETRIAGTYGVLKLTLRPGSYDWQFVPTRGTAADAGSTACHG